ncbi:MAG: ABC transporter ATP-binding protein [Candidatus Wallbacteria bacterium]|nr:ABC transporter ATP-binding protein [Candidatus Wallbacteria bacterium]
MIHIQGLSFGRIIHSIDLDVIKGEMVGIVGRNGAGKSTLLKSILLFHHGVSGEVILNNQDFRQISRNEIARCVSYIPQSFQVDFDIPVMEFLFTARYTYNENRRLSHIRIQEAAEACGTEALLHRSMRVLSGGEMQKVLLTSAVVQDTPVWLCDEPTSSLDPRAEAEFFQLLSLIRRDRPLTVLIVSHNLPELLIRCSRIIALKDGEIAFDAPTEHYSASVLEQIFGIPFCLVSAGKRILLVPGEVEQ